MHPTKLAIIITPLILLTACTPTPHDSKPTIQPKPKNTTLTPQPTLPKTPPPPPTPIIDSNLTFPDALSNSPAPQGILDQQTLITITYLGFDNQIHQGQLVIHQDLAEEVTQIFKELQEANYPIEKIIPISEYNWDDNASVLDNNTSAFNYRTVPNSKTLSKHAQGRAIDLNPYQNPYIDRNGNALTKYQPDHPAALTKNSPIVKIFKKYGWTWGGTWKSVKDYQHFEK